MKNIFIYKHCFLINVQVFSLCTRQYRVSSTIIALLAISPAPVFVPDVKLPPNC